MQMQSPAEVIDHAERVFVLSNLSDDLRTELAKQAAEALKTQKRRTAEDRANTREADRLEPRAYRMRHVPDVVDRNGRTYRGKALEDTPTGETLRDTNGDISAPLRVVDSLSVMWKNGSITERQMLAGRHFQDDFTKANLGGFHNADLGRPIGTGGAVVVESEAILRARDRISDALEKMGGSGSILGSCAWHVLGRGDTLTQWCDRQTSPVGNKIPRLAATGILIGVLSILEWHYAPQKDGKIRAQTLASA
jgi:hypothetical protein